MKSIEETLKQCPEFVHLGVDFWKFKSGKYETEIRVHINNGETNFFNSISAAKSFIDSISYPIVNGEETEKIITDELNIKLVGVE